MHACTVELVGKYSDYGVVHVGIHSSLSHVLATFHPPNYHQLACHKMSLMARLLVAASRMVTLATVLMPRK